jgi:hypothetical protein
MTGSWERRRIFCIEEHWVLEWRRMDMMDRRGNHFNIWHIVAILVHTSMFTTYIRLNSANDPIAFTVDQRNIIPGWDAALPDVPPHEPAKRPATMHWQVLVGWKKTTDWWIAMFTFSTTHFLLLVTSTHVFQFYTRPHEHFSTCTHQFFYNITFAQ